MADKIKNKVVITVETWDMNGEHKIDAIYTIHCHDEYVTHMSKEDIPYLLNRMLGDLNNMTDNKFDDKKGTTLEINI